MAPPAKAFNEKAFGHLCDGINKHMKEIQLGFDLWPMAFVDKPPKLLPTWKGDVKAHKTFDKCNRMVEDDRDSFITLALQLAIKANDRIAKLEDATGTCKVAAENKNSKAETALPGENPVIVQDKKPVQQGNLAKVEKATDTSEVATENKNSKAETVSPGEKPVMVQDKKFVQQGNLAKKVKNKSEVLKATTASLQAEIVHHEINNNSLRATIAQLEGNLAKTQNEKSTLQEELAKLQEDMQFMDMILDNIKDIVNRIPS